MEQVDFMLSDGTALPLSICRSEHSRLCSHAAQNVFLEIKNSLKRRVTAIVRNCYGRVCYKCGVTIELDLDRLPLFEDP